MAAEEKDIVESIKRTDIDRQRNGEIEIQNTLHLAIEKGLGEETIDRLIRLAEWNDARQGEKDFNISFAEFKKECPTIPKDCMANMKGVTKSGARFSYPYSSQEMIDQTIKPILSKNGLSFSWETKYPEKRIAVTCIVRHSSGHSEKTEFQLPYPERQEDILKAIGHAKKNSLVMALGLISEKEYSEFDHKDFEMITEEQVFTIRNLITESGADEEKFLRFIGAEMIHEIKQSSYLKALGALRKKRKQKKEATGENN